MAIVEIESKVYKVEDKVAEKILEIATKVEELEEKNRIFEDCNFDLNRQIEKLTAESTEWESKYYLEQEKNSKALEYINTHDLYIEVIDYDYEENPETTMIRDDIAKEDLSKILKGVGKDER